jgi:hypothetical protein
MNRFPRGRRALNGLASSVFFPESERTSLAARRREKPVTSAAAAGRRRRPTHGHGCRGAGPVGGSNQKENRPLSGSCLRDSFNYKKNDIDLRRMIDAGPGGDRRRPVSQQTHVTNFERVARDSLARDRDHGKPKMEKIEGAEDKLVTSAHHASRKRSNKICIRCPKIAF